MSEGASSGERGKLGTNAGQLKAAGKGAAGMTTALGRSTIAGPRIRTATGGNRGTLVTSGIRGRNPK